MAGWAVNGKRVRRVMRELGLAAEPPARRVRTTDSDHPFPRYPNLVADLTVARPDHVWVADITYVRVRAGFVYLAVLMDVFTRAVRGWELGRSLDGGLTLAGVQRPPPALLLNWVVQFSLRDGEWRRDSWTGAMPGRPE